MELVVQAPGGRRGLWPPLQPTTPNDPHLPDGRPPPLAQRIAAPLTAVDAEIDDENDDQIDDRFSDASSDVVGRPDAANKLTSCDGRRAGGRPHRALSVLKGRYLKFAAVSGNTSVMLNMTAAGCACSRTTPTS